MRQTLFPAQAIGVAVGFVICIVAHHVAHARVAIALGDRTPRLHGRVSLSLKAHTDVLGTIILPIVWTVVTLFGSAFEYVGWGKPQAISPHQLRRGRAGVIAVSLAGPAATLIIAVIGAQVFKQLSLASFGARVVGGITMVAVFLTVWELLPMPGRDGGRILAEFLPQNGKLKMQELAQYEVLFVIGAFFLLRGVVGGLGDLVCNGIAGFDCGILRF